jgi:hypothetical protein
MICKEYKEISFAVRDRICDEWIENYCKELDAVE